MKKHIWMGALCASLLMACSEKNASVERISNQNYEVVSDSIYTRMPGEILYQEGVEERKEKWRNFREERKAV